MKILFQILLPHGEKRSKGEIYIFCAVVIEVNLVWQFRTLSTNARLRVQTTGAHAVKHDDI